MGASRPPPRWRGFDAGLGFERTLVRGPGCVEHGLVNLLRLWFGFTLPVDRRSYVLSGFGLMALKYAVEAGLAWTTTGSFYTPLDFLDPRLEHRREFFGPDRLVAFSLLALSLAFLWIALSMSIRRAVDAGHRASFGLLVLVPVVNVVTMLYLAVRPSDRYSRWTAPGRPHADASMLRPAIVGVAFGWLLAFALIPVGIFVVGKYGEPLFFLTPVVSSLVAAYVFNRPFRFSLGASLAVAQVSVLVGSLVLLLVALEGALCIAMALPIASLGALLGGAIGHVLASRSAMRHGDFALLALVLPMLMGAERWSPTPPLREVVTTVEVDAPPEVVWQHVVSFSELTEPPEWFFLAGIAYPVRAEIAGEGVGTVRHCVFSTGPFVEPITAWEPPQRLAFDVTAQPRPMRELSPWGDIAAPHLEGTLTSHRGEFRLVALAGGRTRLEGSTWYTLDMGPQAYWTLWSDALIGRIHERVLRHVRDLSE